MIKFGKNSCSVPVVASGVVAALMIVFAIVGGVRNYSAIPYWDMWGGVVGFLLKVKEGDHSIWWSLFNEHRIVLARIVFYIDSKFFNGLNYFSVFVNYVLVALTGVVLVLFMNALNYREVVGCRKYYIFIFTLISWVFLWVQSENLHWAFQSQFIFAQMLPLVGLYALAKSIDIDDCKYFVFAFIFGVFSVGAMANGVLCFPVMFAYVLIFRSGLLKVGSLLFASVFFPLIYFYDFHVPEGHGHVISSLIGMPRQYLCYVLMYLGSPFHYLLGKGVFGNQAAILFGAFFVVLWSYLLLKEFTKSTRSPYVMALLFFVGYIIATAIGTAGGRVVFGVEQALSSRYTTPSIMAWAALAISVRDVYVNKNRTASSALSCAVVILTVLMFGFQIKALKSVRDEMFVRNQAALALALNVKDSDYIHSLFSDVEYTMNYARQAEVNGITIFSQPPLVGMKNSLGRPVDTVVKGMCIGAVDHVSLIRDDPDYIRVDGWIYYAVDKKSPLLVTVVNSKNIVSGYLEVGRRRDDVALQYGESAQYSGFGGYIKRSLLTDSMIALGSNPPCLLKLK
ncbi:hypothetical protein [Aquitalea pelogenes]|uniref:hypothetical protein n=1 Tax=Aquitalea pelogenes TaxID=1293573 RepID=UPI000AF35C4B|nr:hypothetical protein [Aquitalea pelogenes]